MERRFKHSLVWLRRDLRLDDHTALLAALDSSEFVTLVFVFDPFILGPLPPDDRRLTFIWESLEDLNYTLREKSAATVHLFHDKPLEVFRTLARSGEFQAIFFNRDYEPLMKKRDREVTDVCLKLGVECLSFKDQVLWEGNEISKDDGQPYRVFTAYKNRWRPMVEQSLLNPRTLPTSAFERIRPLKLVTPTLHTLDQIGFQRRQNLVTGGERPAKQALRLFLKHKLLQYNDLRDLPAENSTSQISPYLRFGNLSIRRLMKILLDQHSSGGPETFISELVWREFFMMILDRFPHVETGNFNPVYNNVKWLNDERWFDAWCSGRTGFPLVDAGMRELNETGLMHNRVRMVTASFLVKHLHVDWRWGERYFASKLLDFELSSNNGNWQWAAGTGVDAAPYFRIFNPTTQGRKFDPEAKYVKQWLPELSNESAKNIYGAARSSLFINYPPPLVDLDRERKVCLELYTGNAV